MHACFICSQDAGYSWSDVRDLTEEVIGPEVTHWATFAVGQVMVHPAAVGEAHHPLRTPTTSHSGSFAFGCHIARPNS